MQNPLRRKSLLKDEPRSGITTIAPTPSFTQLHDVAVSYGELYRTSPAVRAVVDYLSTNIGQIALATYRRRLGRDRERLGPDDPLTSLLRRPSGRISGFELIRSTVADLLCFGNAYWIRVRDSRGAVASLVRVPPASVTVVATDTTEAASYRVRFSGGQRDYAAADVVHFACHNPDSLLLGSSPLESLKGVLSEDKAASDDRAGYWRNAARFSGVIERPLDAPGWSDTARDRFRRDWEAAMTGARNSATTVVMEEGMSFSGASFSPRDSEYVAGRNLTLAFVCSVLNVPMQLLGGGDRNVDAAQRGMIANSIAPWLSLLEESCNVQLVPDIYGSAAANGAIFVEGVLEEKSRGSFLQQSEILERAGGGAWATPNEIRQLANLPPVAGGDRLREPKATIPGGQPEAP